MPKLPINDLTGKQFGMKVVEEYAKNRIWLTRCLNCGHKSKTNTTNLQNYKDGNSGCRNCSGLPKGYSGLLRIYTQYASIAKKLNREFALTLDQFGELTLGTCHYCGKLPSQLSGGNLKKRWKKSNWSDYHYNGIDRKDNSEGYLFNNCLSCCWECNHMKGTKSYEQFIALIDRLVNFRKPTLYGKIQILCGMIASGKSSYARNAAAAGAIIYNDDSLVNMIHGNNYKLYDKNLKVLYKSVEHSILGTALALNKTVIIDRGLNVSLSGRRRWIAIAQSLDFPCEAVIFEKESPECHAQRRVDHDSRDHSYEYWLKVAQHHNNIYCEPSIEEGFDKVDNITFEEIKQRKVF
jgi:predicted kinase